MQKKIFIRIGLVVAIVIGSAVLLSVARPATPSVTNECKETMQDCCKQEKDTDTNGGPDFENLSGKFFSSFAY